MIGKRQIIDENNQPTGKTEDAPVISVCRVPGPYRMRIFNRLGKLIEERWVTFFSDINLEADALRKKHHAMSGAEIVEVEYGKDV